MNSSLSNRYIKLQRMILLMEKRDARGMPVPFDISFVRLSDGKVDSYRGCHLTSRHIEGGTVNVMKKGDFRPRKIRLALILTFNNLKVYH